MRVDSVPCVLQPARDREWRDDVEEPQSPDIVFVTAHDQDALQAFAANSIDYLLKPVDARELDRAIAARGVRRDKPAWSRECESHTGKE